MSMETRGSVYVHMYTYMYAYVYIYDQMQHFELSVNTSCLGHIRLYLSKHTTFAKPSMYFMYTFGQLLLPFSSSGSLVYMPIYGHRLHCWVQLVMCKAHYIYRFVYQTCTGWLHTYTGHEAECRHHERMQGVQLASQQDFCVSYTKVMSTNIIWCVSTGQGWLDTRII